MAGDTGRESPPNLEGLHEVTGNQVLWGGGNVQGSELGQEDASGATWQKQPRRP